MDLEIVPEPSPDERRAIVLALRVEDAEQGPTAWRQAGLEPAPEADQAAAPVRQSRGAARA